MTEREALEKILESINESDTCTSTDIRDQYTYLLLMTIEIEEVLKEFGLVPNYLKDTVVH